MDINTYYDNLVKEYKSNTSISEKCFDSAKKCLAGGETRTVSYYYPYPITIESGKGYTLTDVDGRHYIDCINNYTSLIHGHANEKVTEAICYAASKGTAVPAGIEDQVKLAELLCKRVPCVERVRFCNSGTEATLFATRAAKVYTGKNGIVKIFGGYHGTVDIMEYNVSPKSVDFSNPENNLIPKPDIKGVSEKLSEEMYIIPYNDIGAAKKVLEENHDKIAAVIVEPFLGAGGIIPAKKVYLEGLRKITEQYGVLLIFDEVQALRLSEGGAQKKYGVTPDLAAMAKIIGGGLPVGAVGGKKEIMDVFDPTHDDTVVQSGTFNGNRVTMAAGYAALMQYDQNACDRLDIFADHLEEKMNESIKKLDVPVCVTRSGSLLNYHFMKEKPENYLDARKARSDLLPIMHLEMLRRGIFSAERGLLVLSTPMTMEVIDTIADAFNEALTSTSRFI